MKKVIVNRSILKNKIQEMLSNPEIGWQTTGDLSTAPITISAVVDPSAAETNPENFRFKPQNRAELKSAFATILSDISDDHVAEFYDTIRDTAEKLEKQKNKAGMEMKNKNSHSIEETIRKAIRKIILESQTEDIFKMSPDERRRALAAKGKIPSMPSVVPTRGMSSAEKKELSAKIAHSKPTHSGDVKPTRYAPGESALKSSLSSTMRKISDEDEINETRNVEETIRRVIRKMILEAQDPVQKRLAIAARGKFPSAPTKVPERGLSSADRKDLESKIAHSKPTHSGDVKPTRYPFGASGKAASVEALRSAYEKNVNDLRKTFSSTKMTKIFPDVDVKKEDPINLLDSAIREVQDQISPDFVELFVEAFNSVQDRLGKGATTDSITDDSQFKKDMKDALAEYPLLNPPTNIPANTYSSYILGLGIKVRQAFGAQEDKRSYNVGMEKTAKQISAETGIAQGTVVKDIDIALGHVTLFGKAYEIAQDFSPPTREDEPEEATSVADITQEELFAEDEDLLEVVSSAILDEDDQFESALDQYLVDHLKLNVRDAYSFASDSVDKGEDVGRKKHLIAIQDLHAVKKYTSYIKSSSNKDDEGEYKDQEEHDKLLNAALNETFEYLKKSVEEYYDVQQNIKKKN